MNDQITQVDDGEYKALPTDDPDHVYVKRDNGALPLDCPVIQQVVRHWDDQKGLMGHTIKMEVHLMGDIEVKIVRGKLFVVLVDGKEVARVKKGAR